MSELALPGTIPGLLRRGSPVVAARLIRAPGPRARSRDIVVKAGTRGVVQTAGPDASVVAFEGIPDTLVVRNDALALDLTDATGRAHAAWWVASRFPEDFPAYVLAGTPIAAPGVLWHCDPAMRGRNWVLATWNTNWCLYFTGRPMGLIKVRDVPPLADLNGEDPRLLPDGSRWVDAEALRLVVLHVAGVPRV